MKSSRLPINPARIYDRNEYDGCLVYAGEGGEFIIDYRCYYKSRNFSPGNLSFFRGMLKMKRYDMPCLKKEIYYINFESIIFISLKDFVIFYFNVK